MVKPFYRNIRLLILTLILIFAWGMSSFQSLPRQEDPELVARDAVVSTVFPGASAERVEALVTEVIESELAEIQEIANIESSSRIGFSSVVIELADSVKNSQPVWSRVRDKVGDAANSLPPGAGSPELEEIKAKAYTAIASLTWNQSNEPNYAILGRYAEELQVAMRGINGTEKVKIFGNPDEEISVAINAPDLVALGLSPQQLAEQISLSDAKVSAGQFRGEGSNLAIELNNELDTLDKIRQIPIQNSEGQFTRLSDIAQVQRGIQSPPSNLALVSGKPGVVVGILMDSNLRIDQWATELRAEIENFRATLPQGVSLDLIFDQSGYVEQRISSLMSNLVIGALLVIGVSLVSMGWRSALIVGLALPLSTLLVFGWMQVFGIAIQQMSVTGLIIALGLLIDNAIVVVDEIQVEMEQGHKPLEAATKTVNYLKVPLLASTITTILTFLPIALLPGGSGEFVGSIAQSVIMALISSLALSLTIIAALAALLLGRSRRQSLNQNRQNIFQKILFKPNAWWNVGFTSEWLAIPYSKSIKFALSKPLLAIALTFVIPLIGFIGAQTLESQFFPSVSRDQFHIEVEFPSQTSLAVTEQKIIEAREVILTHSNVEDVHWFLGESAPAFYYNVIGVRDNEASYAQAMVQLKSPQGSATLINELQEELDNLLPNARVLVKQFQQGSPYAAPVEIRIYGSDLNELKRLGTEARAILASIPDIIYAQDNLSESLPKLGLTIDEEQARQAGLNNTAIAQQLEAYLEGALGGSILESTENLPIRVRVGNTERADLSKIASLDLSSTETGNSSALSALGEFKLVPELANIVRRNEQRVNIVQGHITVGVLPPKVFSQFQQQLKAQNFQLPPGYRYEFGGEQAESSEAEGNLLLSVPLLIVGMVSALVLSLNSFRQAAIVAVVAIGCVGMALFSLLVSDSPLGFMAILGIMGLIGIAINDTVIVLSALNENPESKRGDRHAIQKVVVKATRHVVTTTITTVAGFIPLLIGGNPFWQPLAIAIAGGITGSSLLALYFVPAVYLLTKKCNFPQRAKHQEFKI
ncbi:MAG: efflux RND transporter permease subunit [Cyanobacteria bacterium P01_G01_bin.67]